MTRVVGPPRSRRRRWLFLSTTVVAIAMAVVFIPSAFAVHDNVFQLDGEVSTQGYSTPSGAQVYDWGNNNAGNSSSPMTGSNGLFNVVDTGTAPTGTEAVTNNSALVGSGKTFDTAAFARDFQSGSNCTLNSLSTTVCTGDASTYATGSKDTLGVGNGGWQCNKDNNVNSKIDIMNAYAASYFTGGGTSGDHIVYFGLEKNKDNGTNDVGVWLLQGAASCTSPATGAANFNGQHHNKDVLVVSEFSNGGGVSSIQAFQWAANAQFPGDSGCIDSNDWPDPNSNAPGVTPASKGCNGKPIFTANNDCKTAGGVDALCATTNANCVSATLACGKQWNDTVATPWLTWDATKGVGRNQIVSPDFFEGGINLTKIFSSTGETAPSCFNTVVPDTRSSDTITATLFDFVAEQLGECSATVQTSPSSTSDGNTPIPPAGISVGTGSTGVDVYDKAVVTVSGATQFGGSVSFHLCGPTPLSDANYTLCTTGGALIGSSKNISQPSPATATSDAAHLTKAGRYCWRADYSGDSSIGLGASSDSTLANECFKVLPVQPTLTTNATTAVKVGTAIDDTAHLNGTAYEPGTGGLGDGSINPTARTTKAQGSLTFNLYSTSACGTAIATRTISVNGDGDYKASDGTGSGSLSPSAPGIYYWTASYNGDPPNTLGATDPCGSDNESTKVVDARISIGTSGTNQVGHAHTFTVTVEQNDGTGWTAASGVTVSSSTDFGTITGGTCTTTTTNSSGQCTIIVNSSTPGTAHVTASGTVTVSGVSIGVATNGYGALNVSNTKTWVDARISIVDSATNKVGDPHTFTVTVEKNDGTGWSAASGVTVSSSLAGAGSITGGTCTTSTTNSSGQCTITVNSNTVGTATVNASATVTVGGVSIGVATDGYGALTVHNTKTWVDARISIVESATNKVGDPHTFTVTVEKNDGTGWTAASGVTVSSGITGAGSITGGTCTTTTTNSSGQCTITVNSNTPGTGTVNASGTVTVGGVSIGVATDGYGAFTVHNTKTWVDARISIGTSGTNAVGDPHTFTVTVEKNDGTGWSAASGVTVTSGITGVGSITGGTCTTTTTNASGQCTITVNSNTPGTGTVNASGTVTVGGVSIGVATDGYGAFNVSNTKTWVDARISIVDSATNKVGDPHTFTVTVETNDGSGWSGVSGVTVSSSLAGAGSITGGTCTTTTTDSNGQCTITVNSNTPGTATVNASATVTVDGVDVDVATDGFGAFVVHNTKTWVDARISIVDSATNKVGDPHTFTVTVEKNDGTGWSAASGVTVSSGLTGAGSITGGTCTTTTTDSSGQCTITVNSNTPGTATVNASSTVTVGGVSIGVATDGYGALTVHNTKTWVDARISIVDSSTNKVGDPHTFTVTVEQNDGTGWSAASGVTVSSGLTGVGSITGGTCTTTTTNSSGQCTITVNSNTVGTATVNASATVTVGGVSIGVATDGYGALTVHNTKTWVDARISIGTSSTNGITEPHTFTVTVEKNDGTGWSAASGVTVSSSITGMGSITGGTCTTTTTNSSGQCTITVNSNAAGTGTVNASGTVTVGGVSIGVATDGYGALNVDNQKTWVQGSLKWIKRDGGGSLLGGATFQVCATAGTAASAGHTPLCVSVVDNTGQLGYTGADSDPVAGQFELDKYQSFGGSALGGLALGTYTITETSAPAGYTLDPFVDTETIDQAHLNVTASHTFVDTKPGQGCTPGFWKNHTGAWNSTTDSTVSHLIPFLTSPFGYNAGLSNFNNQPFFVIFGLPGGPYRGLSSSLTLIGALNLGGGGFSALARHGTAALLSSGSVQYPYTPTQILNGVRNAFLANNSNQVSSTFPDGVLTDLTNANNLDESACPSS